MWSRRNNQLYSTIFHAVHGTILRFVLPFYALFYRNLVIFRIENISYVIISCSFNFVHSPYYETRVKVSLLKNIRAFNFRTDGSVRN